MFESRINQPQPGGHPGKGMQGLGCGWRSGRGGGGGRAVERGYEGMRMGVGWL